MHSWVLLALGSCLVVSLIQETEAHGRLKEPPGRSSLFRYGYPHRPKNYEDDEVYCGGIGVLWDQNKGKCGVCGDPWNGQRHNEFPNGKYAKNPIITRTFKEGETISVTVDITTNHWGFFNFRICPAISETEEVTQECLDAHELQVVGASKPKYSTRYYLPTQEAKDWTVQVKLPQGLKCQRCVLQWDYTGGNNWGFCRTPEEKELFPGLDGAGGCGPQEHFRGCADVKIE